MTPVNRREFLAQATAATAALAAMPASAMAAPRNALPEDPDRQGDPGQDRHPGLADRDGHRQPRLGPGEQPDQARRQGVHQGRPPRPRPGRHPVRRRRPVRLARLSPRGPEGRPSRELRDPDQDPRHRLRQRQEPPGAVPDGAGRRHDRHRPAALHDQGRLAARPHGLDGLPPPGQVRGDHPRPRHELPRHGPAEDLGQGVVRRGQPRPDQPRGDDHGRGQDQEVVATRSPRSSRRCTTPARA